MQANLWISANIATASSASDMTEKKVAEWSLGPALNELFQNYSANQNHCLLEVFQGPMCRIVTSDNPACPSATSDVAGTGAGADWQKLTKSCPAFATR